MNEIVVNQFAISIKEYNGKRVVTLKDIDMVHGRPDGTAGRNFRTNKEHFIEGEDFYKITPDEFRRTIGEMDTRQQNDVTLITESGYLMLVKSFTDDLAWDVQRKLVNNYFRVQNMANAFANLSPQLQLLISIETKQKEHDKALAAVNNRLDNIGEVIALDTRSWRKDAQHLISKIATVNGGFECMKDIFTEIYRLVEQRAGVSLSRRLANKRARMAEEGISKSKREALSKIDIIGEDKKLIEIYVAIVKEMAIKAGVDELVEVNCDAG